MKNSLILPGEERRQLRSDREVAETQKAKQEVFLSN